MTRPRPAVATWAGVGNTAWSAECDLTQEFSERFGDRLPPAMTQELATLRTRLAAS